MSFLDCYSGYNQELVKKKDRLKITFITKWGTFAYNCIPFGLINIGATFQRVMDFTFKGILGKNIFIYMDDLTIYSKDLMDHPQHLQKIF